MVLRPDQERVRTLLQDTITLLCRNGLSYKNEFNIKALIGITLDQDEVFLVDIKETIKNAPDKENDSEDDDIEDNGLVLDSPTRKRRKRQRSRKRSHGGGGASDLESAASDSVPGTPSNNRVKAEDEESNDAIIIKDEPDYDTNYGNNQDINLSQAQLFPASQDSLQWDPQALSAAQFQSIASSQQQQMNTSLSSLSTASASISSPLQQQQQVIKVEPLEEMICELSHVESLSPELLDTIRAEAPHTPSQLSGFPQGEMEGQDETAERKMSQSTVQATKFGVRVFRDWLMARGKSAEFEALEDTALALVLRTFYTEARDKTGKRYGGNTIRGIRAAINRYLKMPPQNRLIDLISDRVFSQANAALDSYIKANIAEGNANVIHRSTISNADWEKMLNSVALSTETQDGLQNKVFIDLMTHFGRRKKVRLRQVTKQTFEVVVGEDGLEYVRKACDKTSNSGQDTNRQESKKELTMVAQPNNPKCPVKSFKKYITKLDPNCDALYASPKRPFSASSETWYSGPMGKNRLCSMMSRISEKAGLSQKYTNFCLTATVASRLAHWGGGVESRKINETSSIQRYIGAPDRVGAVIHDSRPVQNTIIIPVTFLQPQQSPTVCSQVTIASVTQQPSASDV